MGLYVDGDQVNDATLNSLDALDAIVEEGVAQSGRKYPTLAAAVSAGHKSIGVLPGDYAGALTISASGLDIVGLGTLAISGDVFTAGPRFDDYLSITGPNNTLRNVGIEGSSTHAFIVGVGAHYTKLIDVQVVNPTSSGIALGGSSAVDVVRPILISGTNGSNGITIGANGAAGTFRRLNIVNAYLSGWTGNGIVATNEGADSTAAREIRIVGCDIYDCCDTYGAGISIGTYYRAKIVDNHIEGSGDGDTDSSGIYLGGPVAGGFVAVVGNMLVDNTGYGFQLATGSTRVTLGLNYAYGNGLGAYVNHTACPGWTSPTNGSG